MDYAEQWSQVQEQIAALKERLRALARLSKSLETCMRLQQGCDCTIEEDADAVV